MIERRWSFLFLSILFIIISFSPNILSASRFLQFNENMTIRIYVTENLYADMEIPIDITARVSDAETDQLIPNASVQALIQYEGVDSSPWTREITLKGSIWSSGYYSSSFEHTGAGSYNITVIATKEGYTPGQGTYLLTVRPTRTSRDGIFGWSLGILIGGLFIVGVIFFFIRQLRTSPKNHQL